MTSPDLDFEYIHSIQKLTVYGDSRSEVKYNVQFDEMLYSWLILNEERNISIYENEVEITNLGNGKINPLLNIKLEDADMGFPYINYSIGTEFNTSQHINVWRGAFYTLSVVQPIFTRNDTTFSFRHWDNYNVYSNPSTLKILSGTDKIRTIYYPTQPLTVTNYLEGGNGGTYKVTWDKLPSEHHTINAGTSYNAFDGNVIPDVYTIETDQFSAFNTSWNFLRWENGSTSSSRNEIITSTNKNFTANYKGIQRSNSSTTYNNNGQRKFVRTDDGYLHHVYESMGKVFYELSSDGGTNWQIINMPGWEGISPSIDYFSNFTVVAFQISSVPINVIEIYSFKRINNTYSLADYLNTNYGIHNIYASKPVIALRWGDGFGYESPIFTVVWCDYQNEYQPGLYGVAGTLDLNNGYLEYLTTSPVTYLTGTSANSINPTISTSKLARTVFHLAWQQSTSGNNSKINYGILNITGENTISLSSIQNISLGNGFGQNITPSIIEYSNGPESNAKVSWIGIRQVDDNPTLEYKTFYRSLESGTFKSFGDVARFPVINKTNNNNAFAISWNESNTNTNKFTPSWKSLRYIYPLNVDGKAVQLNNGSSYNGSSNSSGMFGMVFSESTAPYTFSKSLDLASLTPPEKITGTSIALGREGVIYKDSAQFYFAVGDIILNNQTIDFVDLPDTVLIANNEILNQYLYSIPFEVTDNSILYYTVQYGISDSASAVNVLHQDDYISFKMELIDDLTGELIGQYDDITFTKINVAQYDNISYKVNTEGIGNRYVRLRLTTSNNFNPSYSITQRYAVESVLGKKSYQEVNYKGSLKVDSYDLSQNYPNPFNPTTTIKYQIPNAGNVSLKIYDILGREVTTLVDEFKSEGKYEVNFDASKLASGVYIYKIQSGDFVSSKKMMLLK